MISVIFRYFNQDGEEKIAIGSLEYFKTTVKVSKQLVERLAWEHSEEWWSKMVSMQQEELFTLLTETLKSDVLHTFHPN